jgi:hypothetical protein
MKRPPLLFVLLILASSLVLTAPSAAQLIPEGCIDEITTDRVTTTIAYVLTNPTEWAVSYIAIGTGDLPRISPPDGSVYTSSSGETYGVEWTEDSGNPGFKSIKFTPVSNSETYRNGAADVFDITVAGVSSGISQVQIHYGPETDTFTVFSPCL